MVTKKQTAESAIISVAKVIPDRVTCCLKGVTPMIFNRVNEKAKRELLFPSGRKTQADRQASLKHDPLAEYRASPYRHETDAQPTRLYFPPTAFKCVLGTSALDMPGAKKAQIGRLVWIPEKRINIFGVPKLSMMVVRDSGINHAPDIRTRAILEEWACMVTITFIAPLLTEAAIVNLLDAGGMTCGIGDYRQEKGKGNYGQFELCNPDDPDFQRIMAEGGIAAQDAALEAPSCYDADSSELLDWYNAEILRRADKTKGKKLRAAAKDMAEGAALQ